PGVDRRYSAAAFGDEGGAADLGGLAAGDGVDELDGLGHLVGGQLRLGVGDDVVGRRRVGLVGRLDDGVHAPAPLVVDQADDDDVGDGGVVDEGALDLGRVHVGAAGDDHVDAPVGDVEEALLVEVAEVAAGAEPVGGGGLALAAPEVPVQARRRRLEVDLADLARGQVVPVGAEDADLRVAIAAPGGTRMG